MGKYLVLDTETGGISPESSLLQLYARVVDGKSLSTIDDLEVRIRPEDKIYKVTAEALGINHIDLIEHNTKAITTWEASEDLTDLLWKTTENGKEKLTLVGWNVGFDLAFINTHLMPKNVWEQYVSYRVLDLQPVGQMLRTAGRLPGGLGSLTSYAEHFGLNTAGAHDAKRDVEITLGVLEHFLELLSA